MAPTHRPSQPEPDLRSYLVVLRRRWPIIVVTVVSVVAAALVLSFRETPVYRASADLLLRTTPSESMVGDEQVTDFQRELNNEIEIIESEVVRDAVSAATGRDIPDDAVSAEIATDLSDVIRLSATDADPVEAAELVNDYANTYITWRREQRVEDLLGAGEEIQAQITEVQASIDQISVPVADLDRQIAEASDPEQREALVAQRESVVEALEPRLSPLQSQLSFYQEQLDQLELTASLAESGGIRLLSDAEAPAEPVSPTPERDGLVAFAIGLVLGLALSFAFELLDESIKDKNDLERATGGLPTLALIPKAGRGRRDASLVTITDPGSNVTEAYRALRTSLRFMGVERPLRVVQVTSASAGEGKTTTIANLAVALAQAGENVIVASCDLRRPRLHELFDADNRVGLTSALVGDAAVRDLLQPVGPDGNIQLLTSGPVPPNPSELLGLRRTDEIVATLANRADVVLIDCPPVLPVTDALVLSRVVDATVLVAAAHRTSRRQLHRAVELLRQVDAPLLGSVLTEVTGGERYGYDEGYWAQPPKRADRRTRRNGKTAHPEPRPATSR